MRERDKLAREREEQPFRGGLGSATAFRYGHSVAARTIMKNNTELERWLGEHTWFEDAFAIKVDPDPAAANAPDSIRLVLGDQVEGGYVAGAERKIQDYVLAASEIRRSTLGPELSFVPGNCCQGIEVVPTSAGVAFRIDVPGTLEIVCGSLLIEAQAERREQVPPWISDREFGATVQGMPVPPPEQWEAWFRTVGAEVCWRMYGGEAREAPADPRNYEGWYLQEPATIPETSGGVLFFVCREREGALVLQWQREGTSDDLWKAAQQVIALLEPEAWCGNCRFSAAEWRRFAADGSLPAGLGSTAK